VIYLLDANAFMEASRTYYAFDLAPNFWEWLESSDLEGRIGSVELVKQEVAAGTGELVDWANRLSDDFWLSDTNDSVASASEIAEWANDPARKYRQAAKDEFMASADLQLIAHAHAANGTVVTREQSHPESEKRIMIPDAGKAFGVECIEPYEAYRRLGLRLC
jgi:hypothetical protein